MLSFKKPWLAFGSLHAPEAIVSKLDLKDRVNFVQSDSLEYMRTSKDKFDFIFLDGSHAASIVFKEVLLAFRLLNERGIILLHDYYPNLRPLWKNNSCIPGPYLALEKILNKFRNLEILPLGELPWETKLNSNYTSLAILSKK